MSVLTLNVNEVMRTLSAESSSPFVAHDKEVDIVRFAINSGFADIVLDGQVALRVMYQRPGETEVRAQTLTYYDTDGLHNYYDWQLAQSDLAKNGSLMVALCILDISGGEVSEWHTTPCAVRVLSTIHTDDSDEGDDTITPTVKERVAVLESMIQRVASGAPIVVSSASAMTDTEQIYVLSTNGRWYYHNGSAWVAGGEYGAVVTDTTLTQAGVPADAKKTGDEIEDLSNKISEAYPYVRYYGDDFTYSGTAGKSGSGCLGAVRTGAIITLNGGNNSTASASQKNIYFKLTNTKSRVNTSANVRSWSDGITLEEGELYKITCEYLSGTATTEETPLPTVSVYKLGGDTSIGMSSGRTNKGHVRYFTAPSTEINIVLFVPSANIVFVDYTLRITLEKINSEYIPDGYKNVNVFPYTWVQGGIGSNGENYVRNTSIRMQGFHKVDNIYSLTFTSGQTGYIALYDDDYNFLIRYSLTDSVYTREEILSAIPNAVYYRIELGDVNGDVREYDNVTIIAKQYLNGIEKQDSTKEMVNVLKLHCTSSEQWGNCDLKAIITTDIHADTRLLTSLSIMEYWGSDYFDAFINCGDTAATLQSNYPSWYDTHMSLTGIPQINVVGNHDAYSSLGVLGARSAAYNLVVAPIAGQTGLVQPTDAATDSLCYYYYDINGIRIIALDCMYWDADEATWLESVLADAVTNSLPVICVSHYGFGSRSASHISSLWRIKEGYPSNNINIVAAEKVKEFKDNGGIFLCWLVGHSHCDNLYKLNSEYGNQLVVTFASVCERASNLLKSETRGDYNFSCATYMAVDLYQHNIKFLRIGADIDTWGCKHKGLSLDYQTGELISSWS